MNDCLRWVCLTLFAVLLAGCESFGDGALRDAKSQAEIKSSYSYIPLDPLPVSWKPGATCTAHQLGEGDAVPYRDLLGSLPDNAVRLAIGRFSSEGTLSFGVGSTGFEGQRFRIVLDYINADTSNIPFKLYRKDLGSDGNPGRVYNYFNPMAAHLPAIIHRAGGDKGLSDEELDLAVDVVIPVYVGVGLRLTADLEVLEGQANLSSLGALAAEARAGKISGTMVVQTLGITGQQVATSLPLPSSLDETTVQQAILSLGSIKAIMYNDEGDVVLTPRVTGIYNPIEGGAQLVNAIVSELARSAVIWERGCVPRD